MKALTPGIRLHGFCNGAFGRDSYGVKVVVASGTWNGQHWVVAEEDGHLVTATGFSSDLADAWTASTDVEGGAA